MELFDGLEQSESRDNFIKIINGDAVQEVSVLDYDSVHLCVTDPPYFLDGLDNDWHKGLDIIQTHATIVNSLPVGMKFDPEQGKQLQRFIWAIGTKLIRVLKPGAFALFFSQPRLSGRMSVGLEDAGFEIRDQLAWRFTQSAQFKAFSLNHFVDKSDIPNDQKNLIKSTLKNYKTPQMRPQFESIILAQKPKQGTHIENWRLHETGLMDATQLLDGNIPSTVLTVEKPDKEEFNTHPTVKPVKLIEYLIRLFSKEGQVVIDPFLGSGTTAVACHYTKRSCIGIEIQDEYTRLADRRLAHHLCGYHEAVPDYNHPSRW